MFKALAIFVAVIIAGSAFAGLSAVNTVDNAVSSLDQRIEAATR